MDSVQYESTIRSIFLSDKITRLHFNGKISPAMKREGKIGCLTNKIGGIIKRTGF